MPNTSTAEPCQFGYKNCFKSMCTNTSNHKILEIGLMYLILVSYCPRDKRVYYDTLSLYCCKGLRARIRECYLLAIPVSQVARSFDEQQFIYVCICTVIMYSHFQTSQLTGSSFICFLIIVCKSVCAAIFDLLDTTVNSGGLYYAININTFI